MHASRRSTSVQWQAGAGCRSGSGPRSRRQVSVGRRGKDKEQQPRTPKSAAPDAKPAPSRETSKAGEDAPIFLSRQTDEVRELLVELLAEEDPLDVQRGPGFVDCVLSLPPDACEKLRALLSPPEEPPKRHTPADKPRQAEKRPRAPAAASSSPEALTPPPCPLAPDAADGPGRPFSWLLRVLDDFFAYRQANMAPHAGHSHHQHHHHPGPSPAQSSHKDAPPPNALHRLQKQGPGEADDISTYLFQYLGKKFGLDSLVKKAGADLLSALKRYRNDVEVQLFSACLTTGVYDTVDTQFWLACRALVFPLTQSATESAHPGCPTLTRRVIPARHLQRAVKRACEDYPPIIGSRVRAACRRFEPGPAPPASFFPPFSVPGCNPLLVSTPDADDTLPLKKSMVAGHFLAICVVTFKHYRWETSRRQQTAGPKSNSKDPARPREASRLRKARRAETVREPSSDRGSRAEAQPGGDKDEAAGRSQGEAAYRDLFESIGSRAHVDPRRLQQYEIPTHIYAEDPAGGGRGGGLRCTLDALQKSAAQLTHSSDGALAEASTANSPGPHPHAPPNRPAANPSQHTSREESSSLSSNPETHQFGDPWRVDIKPSDFLVPNRRVAENEAAGFGGIDSGQDRSAASRSPYKQTPAGWHHEVPPAGDLYLGDLRASRERKPAQAREQSAGHAAPGSTQSDDLTPERGVPDACPHSGKANTVSSSLQTTGSDGHLRRSRVHADPDDSGNTEGPCLPAPAPRCDQTPRPAAGCQQRLSFDCSPGSNGNQHPPGAQPLHSSDGALGHAHPHAHAYRPVPKQPCADDPFRSRSAEADQLPGEPPVLQGQRGLSEGHRGGPPPWQACEGTARDHAQSLPAHPRATKGTWRRDAAAVERQGSQRLQGGRSLTPATFGDAQPATLDWMALGAQAVRRGPSHDAAPHHSHGHYTGCVDGAKNPSPASPLSPPSPRVAAMQPAPPTPFAWQPAALPTSGPSPSPRIPKFDAGFGEGRTPFHPSLSCLSVATSAGPAVESLAGSAYRETPTADAGQMQLEDLRSSEPASRPAAASSPVADADNDLKASKQSAGQDFILGSSVADASAWSKHTTLTTHDMHHAPRACGQSSEADSLPYFMDDQRRAPADSGGNRATSTPARRPDNDSCELSPFSRASYTEPVATAVAAAVSPAPYGGGSKNGPNVESQIRALEAQVAEASERLKLFAASRAESAYPGPASASRSAGFDPPAGFERRQVPGAVDHHVVPSHAHESAMTDSLSTSRLTALEPAPDALQEVLCARTA
ncbi:hypothetical protein DIPPA_12637 [Diplonema papillatum]|nr:hypothetical protein DIPPA_12637 [Diplonema papillatum]KAJ9456275.1 hypothetical protein DIPPA_12637 [Diplonema papillatum]KAJ9456276.1 hypothetical protein DIPPA_12637 [Diplonema papillatum]